jgi:hypothetical protein
MSAAEYLSAVGDAWDERADAGGVLVFFNYSFIYKIKSV